MFLLVVACVTSHGVCVIAGIITNVRAFDRETTPEYRLRVIVADGGGLTCSIDVVVSITDVNDNAPVFEQLPRGPLRVREDAPINTTLTRVTATDQDVGTSTTQTCKF